MTASKVCTATSSRIRKESSDDRDWYGGDGYSDVMAGRRNHRFRIQAGLRRDRWRVQPGRCALGPGVRRRGVGVRGAADPAGDVAGPAACVVAGRCSVVDRARYAFDTYGADAKHTGSLTLQFCFAVERPGSPSRGPGLSLCTNHHITVD